jgi:hypothetical protein
MQLCPGFPHLKGTSTSDPHHPAHWVQPWVMHAAAGLLAGVAGAIQAAGQNDLSFYANVLLSAAGCLTDTDR